MTFAFLDHSGEMIATELPRVASKAWTDPKNRSNVLVTGTAVGTCAVVREEGVFGSCSNIDHDVVNHISRKKMWGVHTDHHVVDGLVFRVDAEWII